LTVNSPELTSVLFGGFLGSAIFLKIYAISTLIGVQIIGVQLTGVCKMLKPDILNNCKQKLGR
jgi:hypothetical protein